MKNISFLFILILFVSCANVEQKQIREIEILENDLISDTTLILSVDKANKCIEKYIAFANKYPEHNNSPGYLYDAAKVTEGLNKVYDAIKLYGQVESVYPQSDYAPKALFSKAFLLDEKLNQDVKAEKFYIEFIKKYPNHELTPSAAQLIELLYLSDDELKERVLNKNS